LTFKVVLSSEQDSMLLKFRQNGRSELKTLSLDFPVVFIGKGRYLVTDLKHGIGILLGDRAQNVDRVDPYVDSLVRQTNQRIVEEHIEPLLVEHSLMLKQVSLAAVDQLIISQVLLQGLDDSDSELHVMSTVRINQLANLLTLVGALSDQGGVTSEQMLFEKHVELRCLA
jgi:hypothetical protein